ncbi:MAG: hypothetical protein M3Q03_14160 [Chloroflexota bacterium]|nr:hypothetical protein [Chloroflexota bacterium]
MPLLGRPKGQRMGSIGTIRSFMSVLREMSFDDVRRDAERIPKVLVLAPEETTAAGIAVRLTGEANANGVASSGFQGGATDLQRYDVVVVFDPEETERVSDLRRRIHTEGGPAPVFGLGGRRADDDHAIEDLRAKVTERLPDLAPALGRAYPAFRAAATRAVIDETAKANAQFALISNIPAVIPIVGSLAAAGADFLVLTKNQLLMLFKISAIHGRDLHDQWGIMREMLPVVGAGLFWRTAAREAASFIPLAAGTIPKVVIAYAGTVSAGRVADFYYRFGRKPAAFEVKGFYRQAAETVRNLPLPLGGGDRSQSASKSDPGDSSAGGTNGKSS